MWFRTRSAAYVWVELWSGKPSPNPRKAPLSKRHVCHNDVHWAASHGQMAEIPLDCVYRHTWPTAEDTQTSRDKSCYRHIPSPQSYGKVWAPFHLYALVIFYIKTLFWNFGRHVSCDITVIESTESNLQPKFRSFWGISRLLFQLYCYSDYSNGGHKLLHLPFIVQINTYSMSDCYVALCLQTKCTE